MKIITDIQTETVLVEDFAADGLEKLVEAFGSVENYTEHLKEIMAAELNRLAGGDADKIEVKVKIFALEK